MSEATQFYKDEANKVVESAKKEYEDYKSEAVEALEVAKTQAEQYKAK